MGVHFTGDRELFQCGTALFMENVSPSHADALIKGFVETLRVKILHMIKEFKKEHQQKQHLTSSVTLEMTMRNLLHPATWKYVVLCLKHLYYDLLLLTSFTPLSLYHVHLF